MIAARLKDILFPAKCVLCGKLLDREELDLCHGCRTDAPEYPVSRQSIPFVKSWIALWRYEGNPRRSILRYKFGRARGFSECYGRLLAMKIQREYPHGFDIVTWVPISRLRKLRRGYDQVELLAVQVGQELQLRPVRLLKKIRHNPPQSGITGQAQRRANVLGAYRAEPAALAGKKILLLDDVVTTGATVSECARVLLSAGAKEVHCAAIAAAHHQNKSSR